MKKEERKRTKWIFTRSDGVSFPDSDEGTLRVVIHLNSEVLLVYGLFALLFLLFRCVCPYTLCTGCPFELASSLHSSQDTRNKKISLSVAEKTPAIQGHSKQKAGYRT